MGRSRLALAEQAQARQPIFDKKRKEVKVRKQQYEVPEDFIINQIGWKPDALFLETIVSRDIYLPKTTEHIWTHFEQLPFNKMSVAPQLPIELVEDVMDWVEAERDPRSRNIEIQRTLFACSLLRRTSLNRVRKHLFTHVELTSRSLSKFDNALRAAPHHSSLITKLCIFNVPGDRKPISALFIRNKLTNLRTLHLYFLDLTGEHPFLSRALLPHSVQHLRISFMMKSNAAQLIRFLNTFRSLSSLELDFDFANLEHSGQRLAKPYGASSSSLTSLDLLLIPGISVLLYYWADNADSFLRKITKLTLRCGRHDTESEFRRCFDGVWELLDHCKATIEELTLHFWDVPMVDDISDLFRLETFPQLSKVTYRAYRRDIILSYATRQLETLDAARNLSRRSAKSSSCNLKLVEICFDVENLSDLSPDIDNILATATSFLSLHRVRVHANLESYFPKSSHRGILEMDHDSVWHQRDPSQLWELKWEWELKRER